MTEISASAQSNQAVELSKLANQKAAERQEAARAERASSEQTESPAQQVIREVNEEAKAANSNSDRGNNVNLVV